MKSKQTKITYRVKRAYSQYACESDDGSYSLMIVDRDNKRRYVTKRDYKPYATIISREKFDRMSNQIELSQPPVIEKGDDMQTIWEKWHAIGEYEKDREVADYAQAVLDEYNEDHINALKVVVSSRNARVGKIMYETGVDEARAESVLEWMEHMGYVSPERNGERLIFIKDLEDIITVFPFLWRGI